MLEEQKQREEKEKEQKDRADRFSQIYEKHIGSKVFYHLFLNQTVSVFIRDEIAYSNLYYLLFE